MQGTIRLSLWALLVPLLGAAHVLAAAGTTAPLPAARADSVELSPSVLLVGKYDWEVMPSSSTGQPWSRCLDMVWRAVESGSSRLNIVPTHHWLPEEGSLNGISSFCYMHAVAPPGALKDSVYDSNSTGTLVCSPWTQDAIVEFRDAMTLCFAEALRQGLTLYIRPHLDDGRLQGAWRNGLLMDPIQRYGGFSYVDIMLAPLADALRQALQVAVQEETLKPPPGHARPVIYLALQGEMSATIMRYASQWARLIPGLKQRITGRPRATGNATAAGSSVAPGANNSTPPADIKIGVGLNFNRLSDTTSVTKTFDSSRLSWLLWQVGAEPPAGSEREGVPPIDQEGLAQLLTQDLDFIGISAYAPYNLGSGGLALGEFENSAFIFGQEMSRSYGIDVLGLLRSGKLEMQYSEFGIGGGGSYGGMQVAATPSEVALRPFFGVYGEYTAARDPWASPANAAFRREFFYKAMQWLADPDNKTYKVSGVFIWSMNSWDVLAVYPEASGPEGSYRDADVAAAMQAYNTAVRNAASNAVSAVEDGSSSSSGGGGGSTAVWPPADVATSAAAAVAPGAVKDVQVAAAG